MMHTLEMRRHTWHVCSFELCLWPHIHNRETAVRVEQSLQLHAHENGLHTTRNIAAQQSVFTSLRLQHCIGCTRLQISSVSMGMWSTTGAVKRWPGSRRLNAAGAASWDGVPVNAAYEYDGSVSAVIWGLSPHAMQPGICSQDTSQLQM